MWLVVLYGLAAFWALRTLLLLMDRHKRIHLLRLQSEQLREQAEQDIFAVIDKKNQELADQQAEMDTPPASRAA